MRSAMTVCTAVFSAFAWLGAQDAGVTSIQVGFLPGEATPARVVWRGSAFELTSNATASEDRQPTLGRGVFLGADTPATLRLEMVNADTCLMVMQRPPTSGNLLQLGDLRRVDGAWRLVAAAILDKVVPPFGASEPPTWFSRSELVAWDEAARIATIVVMHNIMLTAEQAGGEATSGAVLECRVPLTKVSGDSPVPVLAPPTGKLVAVGRGMRTHRSGSSCVLSTLVEDRSETTGRLVFRLRVWQRDQSGEWRDLSVPRLLVGQPYEYGIARGNDGTLVVAMLEPTNCQTVLRTARLRSDQGNFVVEETVLAQPPGNGVPILWQSTPDGPAAWSFDNGRATRVH